MSEPIAVATANVRDILTFAVEYTAALPALIVADSGSRLSSLLTEAYRNNLADARLIEFEAHAPEDIIAAFDHLPVGAFVVLIQSARFRLNAFRTRIELFKRGLKVIEHPHLGRLADDEIDT